MSHFVIDENNNKVTAYSAEEVLSVLAQAIADGSLANIVASAAFIDKIKCCVSGETNKIAFVTQAKYNELEAAGTIEENVLYEITDDTTVEDINQALTNINESITSLDKRLDELGFKSGIAEYSGFDVAPTSNTLTKQGKIAIFNFSALSATAVIPASSTATITIPEGFRPKAEVSIVAKVNGTFATTLTVGTNGVVSITTSSTATTLFEIINAGWEI